MWLPKDERKLLELYAKKLGGPVREELFDENDLINTLSPHFQAQGIRGVPRYAKAKLRIATANRTLSERELVRYREAGDSIEIRLSVDGYDLGRKYGVWWLWTNLWYTEYIKHHWICVGSSFLGGILTTLLVQWLLA